jgi:hypothetical protein
MSLPLNPHTQNDNKVASFYRHSLKLPQMQALGNIQDFYSLFFSLPSKASKESKKVIPYNIKSKMKEALQCNLPIFLVLVQCQLIFGELFRFTAQPQAPGSSKYLFSIFQPAVESF